MIKSFHCYGCTLNLRGEFKMASEYSTDMRDWISEKSFQELPDEIKEGYKTFCTWWDQKQEPKWTITRWKDVPEEILKAWTLIQDKGYPYLYLCQMVGSGEIAIISAAEMSID